MKIVGWIIFSLLIALLLTEFVLRTSYNYLPFKTWTKLYIEELKKYHFNNDRTLFKSHSILLPDSTIKADLVTIGDSFTFGFSVDPESTFSYRLQELLGKRVINLGINGIGPIEYNRLVEVSLRYKPKLVIYSIFANDFLFCEELKIRKLSKINTYRRLINDENLFATSPPNTIYSAISNLFQKTLDSFFITRILIKNILGILPRERPYYEMIEGNPYVLLDKSYWDVALGGIECKKNNIVNLTNLVKEVKEFGDREKFKLVVLLIPSKEMVLGPLSSKKNSISPDSYFELFEKLENILDRNNIHFINFTNDFQKLSKVKKIYFSIDDHLNEEGHFETALIIKDYLLRNNLLIK